jgi:hypothetical protein
MSRFKKVGWMMLAMLSCGVGPAQASTAASSQVQGFATLSKGVVLVFTNGSRSGIPACSNPGFTTRWALDATTSSGQVAYALLLSARALREQVTLYGTGSCSVLGDAETLGSVVTNGVQ